MELLVEIAASMDEGFDEDSTPSDTEEESDDDDVDAWDDSRFSPNETLGMTKVKTIYIYRNLQVLLQAVSDKKPLAGYVEVVNKDDGQTHFQFKLVHRKPVKQFARQNISFKDSQGVHFHGMWFADIKLERRTVDQCTKSFADIQAEAKLAAVALPLWYLLGKEHPDAFKYCVITNWWKYRMKDGWYRLPTVDPTMHGAKFAERGNGDNDEPMLPCTQFVNNIEVGTL